MHGDLLAFDLETTGLSSTNDEIIEIGIARFRAGQIVEQYQTFVNPGRAIPPDITHLTGIDTDDVAEAPAIDALLPELRNFFGAAPVIAHNIGFDLAFMQKHGLLANNPAIDTLELASILLPSAPRYSLSSLTAQLNIQHEQQHRAYDDAAATGHLYWQLWQKLCDLPASLLVEIIQASQSQNWALRPVWQAALKESLQADRQPPLSQQSVGKALASQASFAEPLDMTQARHSKIAPAAIDEIFDDGGPLAAALGAYEKRGQQIAMAQEVTQALNDGEQLLIEAGTGTGKSIAYLLPAALWALQNGQRVTVSTHTINLQEQLLQNDIPLVQAVVGRELRAALMKGRGNYLCPRRLETLRRRPLESLEDLRALAKILVWRQSSQSGDRGEINLRADEWALWSRLSAQDEDCSAFRCANEMRGACPYYRARQQAEAAHILITNHALLIADAKIQNRTLPEYRNLIVDEAHQLEEAITHGLSRRIDQQIILARLRQLGNAGSGTLGAFLASGRTHFPPKLSEKLAAFIDIIGETIAEMRRYIRFYFRTLHDFAQGKNSGNRQARRLTSNQRKSSAFQVAQAAWKQLAPFFLALTDALQRLCDALPRYKEYQMPDFADYSSEIKAHWTYFANLHEELENFTQAPESNAVYALTVGDSAERLRLQVSPLHIGQMMEEYLNNRLESIVLTSATLRAQGNFEHINERLYSETYRAVALGSPFNFRQACLVYIPNDMPEPGQRSAYQQMLTRGIIELATALKGRVMVLFTSYAQLRETSRAVTPILRLGDIAVYDQSFGGSRAALLENFIKTEQAVLMGTRSFWQGIDIPGDSLRAVVITRLPFAVPSEPVFEARAETYSNSFQQYALPDAILRFRQGFGRLIRRHSDRGLVAIFDSRILSKYYGGAFIESLPDCMLQSGALEKLPQTAAAWLAREAEA